MVYKGLNQIFTHSVAITDARFSTELRSHLGRFFIILHTAPKYLFSNYASFSKTQYFMEKKYKEKTAFLVKLIYLLTMLLSLGLHAKIMNKHNSFAKGTFLIYLTMTGNGHFENSALLSLIFILQQNTGKVGSAKMLNQLKKRHSVGLNKCDREGRTRNRKMVMCPYKPISQSWMTGLNGVYFTKVING